MSRGSTTSASRLRLLRLAVMLLLVANGCAFLTKGANGPADPYLVDPATGARVGASTGAEPDRSVFGEIAFRVEGPGAPAAERCAFLADTVEQRQRGLMNVTSLGDHAGMIFRFDLDTAGAFFMKDTPLPLSIAWFTADGQLVSTADMDPCLGRSDCPTYSATGRYRFALEVARGDLPGLGIVPGSRIVVGGPCP